MEKGSQALVVELHHPRPKRVETDHHHDFTAIRQVDGRDVE